MTIAWSTTRPQGPQWVRSWFYGGPGTGKTVLASCFPQPTFVQMANEDSVATLAGMPSSRPVATLGVAPPNLGQDQPVPVREDMENLLNVLLAAAADGSLYERFGQTIVLDGFSYYNDMVIAEIAHRKITRGDAAGKMSDQKWGLLLQHFLHVRDVLWRLPMHVVITSFAKTKSRGSETLYAGPAVSGQAADLFPGSVGALGYLEVEVGTGRRVCWFTQRSQYPARCRYPGVPEGPIPNHEVWAYLSASPYFAGNGA